MHESSVRYSGESESRGGFLFKLYAPIKARLLGYPAYLTIGRSAYKRGYQKASQRVS